MSSNDFSVFKFGNINHKPIFLSELIGSDSYNEYEIGFNSMQQSCSSCLPDAIDHTTDGMSPLPLNSSPIDNKNILTSSSNIPTVPLPDTPEYRLDPNPNKYRKYYDQQGRPSAFDTAWGKKAIIESASGPRGDGTVVVCIGIDVDFEKCPDFIGGNLFVRQTVYNAYWEIQYGGSAVPRYSFREEYFGISRKISKSTERIIEGEEVFFGFWSQNGQRRHTWDEMFEWKYGRKPSNQESKNITESEVRQWFKERYTTSNWFTTEEPKNVSTRKECAPQTCFYTTQGASSLYDAYVDLANGQRCWAKPVPQLFQTYPEGRLPVICLKFQYPCDRC